MNTNNQVTRGITNMGVARWRGGRDFKEMWEERLEMTPRWEEEILKDFRGELE